MGYTFHIDKLIFSVLSSLDCSDLTSESLEASGFVQSGEIRTSNQDLGSSRILDRTSNPGSSSLLDRTSNPGSSRILDKTSSLDPGSSRILDRTSSPGSNKILDGTSYPGTSMLLDRSVDEDLGICVQYFLNTLVIKKNLSSISINYQVTLFASFHYIFFISFFIANFHNYFGFFFMLT